MNPMDISTFEKLKASGNLPSPKGVALAIMRLMQKEDASMAELARIIRSDPAFVGRLISAANSVSVHPGRPVVSVQEALVVLGMPAVRNLALGLSLLSQYRKGACKAFDYPNYWTASLACGIALQALMLRTHAAQPEEAFSVGLLARVGELALATLYAEDYAEILGRAAEGRLAELTVLEAERFAMNHRDLTVAMLEDWGLPRVFREAVLEHETCDATLFREGSREYRLVQSLALSRLIAEACMADEAQRTALAPRLLALGGRLSIGDGDLAALCEAVLQTLNEWAALLGMRAAGVSGFGELAAAVPAPIPAGAAPAGESPPRLRVLVADGDAAMRGAIRAVLEAEGCQVFETADGEEGLRVALECEPHMMVADRHLPGLDGLALMRALRQTRLGRGMYVLLLTAPGDRDGQIEGFDSGADDYLARPPDPRLLAARMRAGERIVRLHQESEHDREELRRYAAELAITNRRLREAALTDVLTGLPNRRYAMDRIQQEWVASSRNRRPLACVVIDLDSFKQVNDDYGHDIGDAYLKQVAAALRGALRAEDVVCRTGGDEFLVICPNTALQAALACAERMRSAVAKMPVLIGSRRLQACLSAGVAERDRSMADPDALIKCADEGVYLAKQQGRDCVASPQFAASC